MSAKGGVKRKTLFPELGVRIPDHFRRVVTAADVTAGNIDFFSKKVIVFVEFRLYAAGVVGGSAIAASTGVQVKAWDGAIVLTAGAQGSGGTRIRVDNAGAVDWIAGEIMTVIAYEAEYTPA